MNGTFFDCYKVVPVLKKYEKNKDNYKNRIGYNGNEEDGRKRPSDSISADAGMMIRSVNLGRQCD